MTPSLHVGPWLRAGGRAEKGADCCRFLWMRIDTLATFLTISTATPVSRYSASFTGDCPDGEGARDVSQIGDRGACRADSTKLYIPTRSDEETNANARTGRHPIRREQGEQYGKSNIVTLVDVFLGLSCQRTMRRRVILSPVSLASFAKKRKPTTHDCEILLWR